MPIKKKTFNDIGDLVDFFSDRTPTENAAYVINGRGISYLREAMEILGFNSFESLGKGQYAFVSKLQGTGISEEFGLVLRISNDSNYPTADLPHILKPVYKIKIPNSSISASLFPCGLNGVASDNDAKILKLAIASHGYNAAECDTYNIVVLGDGSPYLADPGNVNWGKYSDTQNDDKGGIDHSVRVLKEEGASPERRNRWLIKELLFEGLRNKFKWSFEAQEQGIKTEFRTGVFPTEEMLEKLSALSEKYKKIENKPDVFSFEEVIEKIKARFESTEFDLKNKVTDEFNNAIEIINRSFADSDFSNVYILSQGKLEGIRKRNSTIKSINSEIDKLNKSSRYIKLPESWSSFDYDTSEFHALKSAIKRISDKAISGGKAVEEPLCCILNIVLLDHEIEKKTETLALVKDKIEIFDKLTQSAQNVATMGGRHNNFSLSERALKNLASKFDELYEKGDKAAINEMMEGFDK